MTGHVRKDKKTNKYMFVIEVGCKGNRKRRVGKNFKTKREAKKAMNKLMAELQKEGVGNEAKNDLTIEDYLEYWLKSYAESRTAPNTYKGYERMIRVHLKPSLGKIKLGKLTVKDIQDYYVEKLTATNVKGRGKKDKRGLSAQTVKHHHRLLCKALNDAVDWEFINRNVAKKAKAPKPQKYKSTTYSTGELKRLYEAAKASEIYFPIIYTAAQTGARLGELRALTWSDIDFYNRKMYITKTAYDDKEEGVKIKDIPKNGSHRYIIIGKSLLKFLKEHKENYQKTKNLLGKSFNPLDLVFANSKGKYLDTRELSRAYKKAIKRAGLPDSRFHDLRHSHATILLQKNVHPKIVSDRLGHSKISITLDLYRHVIPSLQDGAVEIFDDAFDD